MVTSVTTADQRMRSQFGASSSSSPPLREIGQHHRAGIRRGEEQHEADEDRQADDDLRQRIVFQQQVDRHRRLFQRGLAQVGRAVVHHQVQGAVAEYRQPGQGEAQRDQQHPQTSSRTLRPREMRAMNIPTKGAQEIHQAQ